ncbi:MAG: DUF4920 domain-containing protein [Gammaproteobacteria bacterium]
MRAVAILIAVLPMTSFGGAAGTDRVVRLSEPVTVTDGYEIYGAPLEISSQAVSLEEAVERVEENVGKEVVISTMVAQVCQKKGCFFVAQDGDTVARVTFKDYGFFIPTDSSGKTVLLRGVLNSSKVSDERAAHLASDLGNASPQAIASIRHDIVASAVAVPKF